MPSSRAICATTGAAPVPVPPPMPAVMNSMSQPVIISMIRSRSSTAAWRPISGSAPAPSPLVMLLPICSDVLTLEALSACASVLMQMKSTPSMPVAPMWVTALPPPPPTPMTLITALWLYASMSSNMSVSSRIGRLNDRKSEMTLKPALHAVERTAHAAAEQRPARRGRRVLARVQQQAHGGRVDRVLHGVGEPADLAGHPQAHRHVEDLLGHVDGPFHAGAPAGEHDAGRDDFLESAPPQFLAYQIEQFLVARLDDFGERLACQPPRRPVPDARRLDALVRVGEL